MFQTKDERREAAWNDKAERRGVQKSNVRKWFLAESTWQLLPPPGEPLLTLPGPLKITTGLLCFSIW